MDIALNNNQLDYYCEKYLLENYNKYLAENNLKDSRENFENFIFQFLSKKN